MKELQQYKIDRHVAFVRNRMNQRFQRTDRRTIDRKIESVRNRIKHRHELQHNFNSPGTSLKKVCISTKPLSDLLFLL